MLLGVAAKYIALKFEFYSGAFSDISHIYTKFCFTT